VTAGDTSSSAGRDRGWPPATPEYRAAIIASSDSGVRGVVNVALYVYFNLRARANLDQLIRVRPNQIGSPSWGRFYWMNPRSRSYGPSSTMGVLRRVDETD
jgi:hypothetical protein